MPQAFDPATLHSLLAREQRAPRYTSYPTAMEFSSGFSLEDYRRAVQRTNEEPVPADLSLYLHIPFCASACYYCGCHRIISRNGEVHQRYLEHLLQEIELQGRLFAADRQVRQIHLGGGTPNILRPRQLGRLLNTIVSHFKLAGDCEVSLEVDPRQYRPRDAQAWALLGFNRISLGVQDMDPNVQQQINRRQSSAMITALVKEARQAGINSINFDLIYGLPGQNLQRFERTLNFVRELRPDRVAIFHYAHMPKRFPAQRAIDEAQLPSLATAFAIQAHSRTVLLDAGYAHIGMDHYALPHDELARARHDGRLQRNFQGYTVLGDCDLVGLGVSAISKVGNVFAQNITDIGAYEKSLHQGALAIYRGLRQSYADRVRAYIIEQIMCQGRIDADTLDRVWHVSLADDFADDLRRLHKLDPQGIWASLDAKGLQVSQTGQAFLRLIARCFDAYAETRGGRDQKPLLDMRKATNGGAQ